MTIETYLKDRGNSVLSNIKEKDIGLFNSDSELLSILSKLNKSAEDSSDSINFLSEHIDDIEEAIDNVLNAVLLKISFMRSSVSNMNRSFYTPATNSVNSDISILDLTKGKYDNMSFSITDSGLIIDTSNVLELGEA